MHQARLIIEQMKNKVADSHQSWKSSKSIISALGIQQPEVWAILHMYKTWNSGEPSQVLILLPTVKWLIQEVTKEPRTTLNCCSEPSVPIRKPDSSW